MQKSSLFSNQSLFSEEQLFEFVKGNPLTQALLKLYTDSSYEWFVLEEKGGGVHVGDSNINNTITSHLTPLQLRDIIEADCLFLTTLAKLHPFEEISVKSTKDFVGIIARQQSEVLGTLIHLKEASMYTILSSTEIKKFEPTNFEVDTKEQYSKSLDSNEWFDKALKLINNISETGSGVTHLANLINLAGEHKSRTIVSLANHLALRSNKVGINADRFRELNLNAIAELLETEGHQPKLILKVREELERL